MKKSKHYSKPRSTADPPVSIDRVQPQALDFEEVLLGAMMLESNDEFVSATIQKARPEHFYCKKHQLILKSIKELKEQNLPTDILSVTGQLRKNDDLDAVGGPYSIAVLVNRLASSANIEYWFSIVYQKFLQREMIRIGLDKVQLAFMDSTDCFDLLSEFKGELDKLGHTVVDTILTSADRLGGEMIMELEQIHLHKSRNIPLPRTAYNTGWPRFDEVVTLGKDKIILIAGAASSGKSRFIRAILYRLLEKYADVSVCWISLEDSRQDLLRSYLASKVFITAKRIKAFEYEHSKIEKLKDHTRKFQTFDIEFIDQTVRSDDVISRFATFCEHRKDRFNILVVDNILSLDDQNDFKFDSNGFCNHVMQNLLKCRQKTKGLIIPIHHFNDAQQDKENLRTGYRPVLKDMKGSETFRRTPNQVLLINSFNIYKDLMSEYSGDEHNILEHLFIVDTGKNREDKIADSSALIHFFTEMAYDQFWEIPLPDSTLSTPKQLI